MEKKRNVPLDNIAIEFFLGLLNNTSCMNFNTRIKKSSSKNN